MSHHHVMKTPIQLQQIPHFMKKTTVFNTAIFVGLVSSASAANVLINGSFELTSNPIAVKTTNPAWGDTAAASGLTGWAQSGAGAYGLANGDGFGADPAGAPYFAGNTDTQLTALNGSTFLTSTSGGKKVLSQTINGLGEGTIDLSYNLGKISFAGTGALTLQFEVFNGADDSAASLYNVTTDVNGLNNLTWKSFGATGLEVTGSEVFVRISMVDENDNAQLAIDHVTMDFIPEPSSSVLLGLAALGTIARRRRN